MICRKLYYVAADSDTLVVAELDGTYQKTIVSVGLFEPRGVAVHPFKGYNVFLFFFSSVTISGSSVVTSGNFRHCSFKAISGVKIYS